MSMKTISIMSAAILCGGSLYAFDTNTSGAIIDSTGLSATYTQSLKANGPTIIGMKGDALVYPAYNTKGTWGTEIIVRNNLSTGIVAKAVVYAGNDSRELKDFNIYLSANDTCRFRMANGKITSTDDSIVISESLQDDSIHVFADENNPFVTDLPETKGYVMIYAMGESNITSHGSDAKSKIFEQYRANLTISRPNWNTGLNMTNGVYTGGDGTEAGGSVTVAPYLSDTNASILKDVNDSALSGTVRIFNAQGTTRDMLLNAIALANFTESHRIMLWAPGEYAAIVDRDILSSGATGRNGTVNTSPYAIYDEAIVGFESQLFVKTNSYYTYNNQGSTPDVDNKLLLTQIYKRTLTQLGNKDGRGSTDGYWKIRDCMETNGKTKGFSFQAEGTVWDESENNPDTTVGGGLIVSPANSGPDMGYCNELAEIVRPESETDFADKNGYISYTFGPKGIPALITQMSASQAGDDYRINWLSSIVERGAINYSLVP